MRNRIAPNVSASLIHELRMVIQQLFGNRQENYYSMRIAEAQVKAAEKAPAMKCCFCVGKPTDAKTIIGGFAVCVKHEAGMLLHHKDYQAYAFKLQS